MEFILLPTCYENDKILKHGFIMFIAMLVLNVPRIILYYFVQSNVINTIAYCISIYLTLFAIARIAIWDQEKYYAEKNSQG